jgi:hypothetical protein
VTVPEIAGLNLMQKRATLGARRTAQEVTMVDGEAVVLPAMGA